MQHQGGKILLINNSQQIFSDIKTIVDLCPKVCLKTARSFKKAKTKIEEEHYSLIIINPHFGQEKTIEFYKSIRSQIPRKTKVIIVSENYEFDNILKYLKLGIDSATTIPIHKDHLLYLIQRCCNLILRDQTRVISHGNWQLFIDSKYLLFRTSKVFISKTETSILEFLFYQKKDCKLLMLQKYLKEQDIEITEESLRAIISRLRKKIRKQMGLDLIKNKYGDGYYLSF